MHALILRWLMVAGMVATLSAMGADTKPPAVYLPYGYSAANLGPLPVVSAWGNPLAFTQQVIPFDGDTEELKQAGFETQFTNCLFQLAESLSFAGADLSKLLRLNVYLRNDQDRVRVQAFLGRHLPNVTSSLTFVTGELEHPDAMLAMDAIALSSIKHRQIPILARLVERIREGRHGDVARPLLMGRKVFISGQAVRADTLGEATRKTMLQLGETLDFLGLKWNDVVQIKSFLQPMSEVKGVASEISRFFRTNQVPPQVFVEWTSKTPIEIELVVNGGPSQKNDPLVEYLTPPKMKASPVFTRVVRVNRGKLIFTSSLYGPTDMGLEHEIRSIFDELKLSLHVMGSDLRHMVKATYYVTNADSSRLLGKLRPEYYDPERPPAASKAAISGTGLRNHAINLDMIAVAEEAKLPIPK